MDISFDLPTWLVVFYHCIGTVSLILNSGTILLVVFKSDTIDNFRYCILVFQILCTITDIHLTFFMEPIPLFPIISGYCVGFLATYFDVWAHYLMAFMVAIISAQMEWLVYCFMRKHQTLAKIMCRHVCPKRLFRLGEFGIPFLPVFVFCAFCKAGMPRLEQMDYVRQVFPKYTSDYSKLPNFAIYNLNFWFILMAVVAIVGGIFCGLVFIISTYDMFQILRGVQRKISTTNFKRHQAAVKSLLAQFSVTSLCLLPPFLFVVVIMSEFRYAQVTVQFLLTIFASHSSINAIVLVVTTPPFRNFVLRKSMRNTLVVKVSINGALTDAHTTIIAQPFPLTPMICGHYKGLLGSLFNDILPYYQVAFSITSIVTQVEALVFCFYRKHQTIAKVMNGHVCPKSFTYTIWMIAFGTPAWLFYALLQAGMTREEQLDFVKTNYPEYLKQFSQVTNVALFSLNIWMKAICINAAVGVFVSSFAFSATTFDLFRMLRSMRKRVSAYNYKRHKAAVHSLFAQFIASTVLLIPPFVYMIVSTQGYGNGQVAIQVILAVFSLRSSVNALVLIVTTPPYRKFVLRIKPRLNSIAVSSSGNSNNQLHH